MTIIYIIEVLGNFPSIDILAACQAHQDLVCLIIPGISYLVSRVFDLMLGVDYREEVIMELML